MTDHRIEAGGALRGRVALPGCKGISHRALLLAAVAAEHADDDLADFPYVFASSRQGFASHYHTDSSGTMEPLLDMVLEKIPGPAVDPDAPLRMLVTTLDWSDYVGRIAIGRIESGRLVKSAPIVPQ